MKSGPYKETFWNPPPGIKGDRCNSDIFEDEYNRVVFDTPAKDTPGPDGIPFFLFKRMSGTMHKAFVFLFQTCFKIGYFPKPLKHAAIVPIPKLKKGTFRTISLISVIAKVFERLLNNRVLSFVIDNEIIIENQIGGRHAQSTVQHLASLSQDILMAFQKKLAHLFGIPGLKRCVHVSDPSTLMQKVVCSRHTR